MNMIESARSLAKKFNLPINTAKSIVSSILKDLANAIVMADGDDKVRIKFNTYTANKKRCNSKAKIGETIKISDKEIIGFILEKALKNKKTINRAKKA
jgi:nucleoid DNA-binding protein